jgi:hypothetical protein
MKQKLLTFVLFLITATATAQVQAYPVPDLTFCQVPGQGIAVDLTTQIPIVLGAQDPQMYDVTFHLSMAAAQNGASAITNPTAFFATNGQVIYIRVSEIASSEYAITSFQIELTNLPLPAQNTAFNCDHYTLPPLTIGAYYTGPGGAGTIVPPGTVITQSTILYIYAESNGCSATTELTITIWDIPDGTIVPYVVCTPDGTPGVFDLTSRIADLTGQHPWAFVEFFPTEADAIANTNEIANAQAFTATSAIQTVYARIFLDGTPVCYWYKPITLATETCTSNSISGVVRYDSDGGGCSASDVPAQSIPVFNYFGNNIYQTFTDADGGYSFNGTPDGGNTVLVTQLPQSGAVTPIAHQVTLPGIVTGKDFCITVPNPVQDVSVAIYPISQARPGFNATYSLVITNSGTIPLSGTVNLYFPAAKVTFVSSYPSMTVSGNSLSLNYANLQAFQSRSIYITFLVQPPQIVPLGDTLVYAATITPATDNNSADNTAILTQTVVNSYDPNDINVLEGATITDIQADGYLHYTIRFQNIGNADALRVRIESMLDSKLDYNTIQPVSASHAYHFERKNDKLTVRFDDIYLAGSQYDEPNSHGYITYRIKPNASVTIGDSMSANANIYFDFNDPIATNIVTTTVQAPAGTADFAINGFEMYPNPANGIVTLKVAETSDADVTVTDVLGKRVHSAKMAVQEQDIDITALNSGIYFVKVTVEGQSATKKLIVK